MGREQLLALHGAKNDRLIGIDGRVYYDLTSGWNVTNAGWNNEAIFTDWIEAARALPFRPSWCTDPNQERFKEQLGSIFPGYIPILSCSGSEAIDNALKVARVTTGRGGVACVGDAYHGSTLGAALAAGYTVDHIDALGLDNRRFALPAPVSDADLATIEALLTREDSIGAVVFETVLTNAGCRVVPDAFLNLLQRLSDEFGFLLVCDEIGTGMNRTGHPWSFQGRPIRPHVITCGKALTNGLYPLSLALVANDLRSFLDEASFASTYGGSPAGCAAALSTLAFHQAADLGSRALELASAVTAIFESNGRKLGGHFDIHGVGLSMAVNIGGGDPEFAHASRPKKIIQSLLERGIFAVLSPDGQQLMITPALTAELEPLMDTLDVVAETIVASRSVR